MQPTIGIDGAHMRIDKQTGERISNMQRTGISGAKERSPQEINQVADEFEALFISQMLENMFNTVPVSEELGGGFGEEMFRSLMVDEYGKILAKTGGIGLSDHVKREMLKTQEVE